MEKAVTNGKTSAGYYVAYPKKLSVKKYNDWVNKKNTKYKILDVKQKEYIEFGDLIANITEIHFLPIEEMGKYSSNQVYEESVKTVTTLTQMMSLRKIYPQYKITKFTDSQIGSKLVSKEVDIKDFFTLFPEYLQNTAIKEIYLEKSFPEYFQYYQDYEIAEEFVRKNVASRSIAWIKERLPYLNGHIDTQRIIDAVDKRILSSNVANLVDQNIEFYENKYFSRQKYDDYMASKQTLISLLSEFDNYAVALKERPNIKTEATDEYINRKWNSGINSWRRLVSDFPEKRNELISYTRRWLNSCNSYYKCKWSDDIQNRINQLNNCIRELQMYIFSEVPDEDGQQLARTYRETADNAKNKYLADLPVVQRYESELISAVRKIAKAVRETSIIPKYKTKKGYGSSEIDFEIYMYAHGSATSTSAYYDNGVYYQGFFGTIKESDNTRTMDNFVLKFVKETRYVTLWDYNLDKTENMQRAEKIIEQFKQYGINEWYKIEF
ncbi:MAG: hypothetical protein LBG92_01390 [Prevotellaceae bacterium]|nr:hypothetical protein [Prevotellaceae bacterium]